MSRYGSVGFDALCVGHCPFFCCTRNLLIPWRGDSAPNYSRQIRLRFLPPCEESLTRGFVFGFSFDKVFNAAGQQQCRVCRPGSGGSSCCFPSFHYSMSGWRNEVLEILVRGICGYPPVVSQYQPRNGKELIGSREPDEEGRIEAKDMGYRAAYHTREGDWGAPAEEGGANNETLSHGAPAIRSSKPTE